MGFAVPCARQQDRPLISTARDPVTPAGGRSSRDGTPAVSLRRVHVLVQLKDVVRVVPALEPDETVPRRAVRGPDACSALVASEVVRIDAAREEGRHLGEEVADPGGGLGRFGGLEPQRDRGEAVAGAPMAERCLARPDTAHATVEMLEEPE